MTGNGDTADFRSEASDALARLRTRLLEIRLVPTVLDVQRRYVEARGSALAASITLYGFLAFFAVTVLAIGVVFALLVWLLLFGRVVVYVAIIEAGGWERHHGEDRRDIGVPALPGR